jgi:hypothetical protein
MTDQIDLQTKSDVPPPTSVGDVQSLEKDDFFQDYEGRFENDFRREFRDATGMAADDEAIALDPRALYRALFLPKDGSAADAVRASFKRLAEATEDAEVILKRTWMIMATNYISHRMKHGGRPGEVDCLQEMIQGYSKLLNDVYLDMSQSVALEIPEIDRNPDSYRQIVDDFRRYMLEDCPGDVKKELRVFTCYRGIPHRITRRSGWRGRSVGDLPRFPHPDCDPRAYWTRAGGESGARYRLSRLFERHRRVNRGSDLFAFHPSRRARRAA